jgi:hypothetical protein
MGLHHSNMKTTNSTGNLKVVFQNVGGDYNIQVKKGG